MVFEIQHHARMLADPVRLEAFRAALGKAVRPGDRVVDIGTGTGILASYAAALTDAQVYGIEYFPEAATLARLMVERAGLTNVRIVQGSSFKCALPEPPDVVVTETIGALGPEENIVELTHTFLRRFPMVRQLIPARLALFAVPVNASPVDAIYQGFLRGFGAGSHGDFDYRAIADELDAHAGTQLFTTDLTGARVLGDELRLVEYRLGMDDRADFTTSVPAPGGEANALHLFFRAELADGLVLTSFAGDPMTHWRHSFVRIPTGARNLRLSYSSATRKFCFEWR
jgi:SAM-dependent methyltransferase